MKKNKTEYAQCAECETWFPFTRSPKGGNIPKVCGKKCRDIRKARKNKEYKAAHKITKAGKDSGKRMCRFPGCDQLTARNGLNYLYCQRHWDLLQEGCSDQYENCIYDVEVRPGNVTGLKDGLRYGEEFI